MFNPLTSTPQLFLMLDLPAWKKFEGVTVEDLTALKGVGAATAKKILARVSELSD